MSDSTTTDVPDHPPIQCLLELRYDGSVSVTARHGCSEEEIRDLLGQFAGGTWPADSAADGVTARREDAA